MLVDVEALVEVLLLLDVRVGREQIGAVTGVPEQLGDRGVALVEFAVGVIRAVFAREQPGKHRRVRGHGRSGRRDAVVEHTRRLGPAFEKRRRLLVVAVDAQPVGAHRVPDDPQYVGSTRLRARAAVAGAGDDEQDRRHDDRDRPRRALNSHSRVP
jgi:hypothetical protein